MNDGIIFFNFSFLPFFCMAFKFYMLSRTLTLECGEKKLKLQIMALRRKMFLKKLLNGKNVEKQA